MKITKRQLRRIIREEKARLLNEQGASIELLDARDNLLGLIQTMDPGEAGFFIEDLIQELQMLQQEM